MACGKRRRARRVTSSASPGNSICPIARFAGAAPSRRRACRPQPGPRAIACWPKQLGRGARRISSPRLPGAAGECRNLARVAARLARANAAVEVLVDGAERYLSLRDRSDAARFGFDASAFAGLAEEIRLRLLMRAIDRVGHEGPAELGKAEALLAALDRAIAEGEGGLKQTLAGAAISL